ALDGRLEGLFARGIDPDSEDTAVPRSGADTRWPPRDEVLAFAAQADRAVLDALRDAPLENARAHVPEGVASLGAVRDRVPFGWDNEFDAHEVHVRPFDIDIHSVTNADY